MQKIKKAKMDKIKRTKEIKLRLTEDEHKRLLMIAGNQQLASFIRETALNALQDDLIKHIAKKAEKHEKLQQEKIKSLSVSPDLLRELALIGNNINQIARAINSSDLKTLDTVKLALELDAINQSLKEIKEFYAS